MEESYERGREELRFLPIGPLSVAAGLLSQAKDTRTGPQRELSASCPACKPRKNGVLPVGNGYQNWGGEEGESVGYGSRVVKVVGFFLMFHSLI